MSTIWGISLFPVLVCNTIMKTIYEIRLENLTQLIKRYGSAAALSKEIDRSPSQISQWTTGQKRIGNALSRHIEKALSLGNGWMDTDANSVRINHAMQVPFSSSDGVNVPHLKESQDKAFGNLALSMDWITHNLPPNTEPKSLRFLHSNDDSMEPTFVVGDIILADISINFIDGNGIYILSSNDSIFIRRITRDITSKYFISNDSPLMKSVKSMDEYKNIQILAKAIWCWSGKRI